MEVLAAVLHEARVALAAGEVGVDELDEAVDVLGRHLLCVSPDSKEKGKKRKKRWCAGAGIARGRWGSMSWKRPEGKGRGKWVTYRLVALVKVVHISIQNLDKQLDGRRRLHARVRHPERALQALKHPLAVTVQLQQSVTAQHNPPSTTSTPRGQLTFDSSVSSADVAHQR